MARQRGVSRMHVAFTPFEDLGGDGLGVVPPEFAGHATEECERLDETVKDGLGAFGGQCECEG